MPAVSRRDFLRVGSALSEAFALSRMTGRAASAAQAPSVLVMVFDAMSAKNLSLYGYRRKTTPNLERFAQRATVYNQHYSAGNYTTPGTASLLTGLYPWTHRALNYSGLIARSQAAHNLFRAMGNQYHRLAFSQNMAPNYFFAQFGREIEKVLSPASFSRVDAIVYDKISRDLQASHIAFDDFLFQDGTPPASLVFGVLQRIMVRRAAATAPADEYPRGLPRTANYPIFFALKDVFDGLIATVERLTAPSLTYLHTWSPHDPYRPTKDFDHYFLDNWRPVLKPEHQLGDHSKPSHMNDRRQNYDEYIANLDFEFGRLLDVLQARGILEDSYVVVTSDHGEMFERGVEGHLTPLLYDPVVRIPLIVSSPGQSSRSDINTPTSSVDVLPTLVRLSGGDMPAWCEGQVLPGLGGPEDPEQSVYMMDAKENSAFRPLRHASFGLRKGPYKLIYYKGYPQYRKKDRFELYDIASDPEELADLYPQAPSFAKALQDELLAKVDAENARFTG